MSILISGDFHANAVGELRSITAETLQEQFGGEYAGIKYHIIAGDCGFLWPENEKQDRFNLSVLNRPPFIRYPLSKGRKSRAAAPKTPQNFSSAAVKTAAQEIEAE